MHIKSTFDHTLDSGEAIELEYEIIIDEIFHKIEVVPTGMDDTTVIDYNGIITTGVEIVAGVAVVAALAIVGLQALIVVGVGTGTTAGAAEAAGGLAALIAVIKNEKN